MRGSALPGLSFGACAVLLLLAPCRAGEEEARAAWTWMEAAAAHRTAVLRQAKILREGAADDAHRDQARTTSLDVLRLASDLHARAEDAFREAFEASDLDAWDVKSDADLLRRGLDLAARHALEEDPRRAVEIWDRLIQRLPESIEAGRARTTWLPIALPSTGDLDAARTRLLALSKEVGDERRPELLVSVGDTRALEGDYARARARYAEARALIPEEADRNDPRGRLRGGLDLRLRLVGRPAPEIEGATWFGGEARPLSAFRGQVVLLDFWSTWCGPCLRGLPHLDDLQRTYAGRGLRVLGITRRYDKKGVLPEREDSESGAVFPRVLYTGDTREAYVEHLRAFRERTKVGFPFLLVGKGISTDYPVTGLPTMLIVDADGTVGFVAIGGRRHHLLRLAIERRLLD